MKNDQCIPEGPPTSSVTGSHAFGRCTGCGQGTTWYCEGCCAFWCDQCVPYDDCPDCYGAE